LPLLAPFVCRDGLSLMLDTRPLRGRALHAPEEHAGGLRRRRHQPRKPHPHPQRKSSISCHGHRRSPPPRKRY
jgi:hypothetical protein